MDAAKLRKLVKAKYSPPAWAVFDEVRNCTGFARDVQSADLMAFGLWPSRGLAIEGFEIKAYRSDWLHELKQPRKSDDLIGYCDRWWVVAPRDTVELIEVPPNWGLLVPSKNGRGLSIEKKAPDLEVKEVSRDLLMAVLRQADARVKKVEDEYVKRSDIQAEIDDAVKRRRDLDKNYKDRYDRLKLKVDAFYKQTELSIEYGTHNWPKIAAIVRLLQNHPGAIARFFSEIRREMTAISRILGSCETELEEARSRVENTLGVQSNELLPRHFQR